MRLISYKYCIITYYIILEIVLFCTFRFSISLIQMMNPLEVLMRSLFRFYTFIIFGKKQFQNHALVDGDSFAHAFVNNDN